MHERAQIRQAVVAQLIGPAPSWRTSAQDRVFSSRHAPIPTSELPCINVYSAAEEVDPRKTAPRELMRTFSLIVEAWVRSREPLDDQLDAFALEIETAMDADLNPGGAFEAVLTGTDFAMSTTGDRPLGLVTLTYSVTYYTDLRIAAPVDLFEIADVRTDIKNLAPADEAHDTLTNLNQE